MASTEEVLKALQNAKITTLAATEPEELVIDAESRTITVPSSERLFGVTGDMNIERKYFRCPKIVGDNVDLSTHQIFIAYVYTETESGSIFPSIGVAPYHCEDVEVDGEDITFSWKLTGNVFKNPGFILFKIYAKKTETDPNTVFNTTPAIGTVLATIPDGTEEIGEEYPDVIAQIFDRLDALESGGGGGTGGTTNYENLSNKPQLNGVTLEGNKTLDQVGVLAKNQGASNSGKYLSVGSDGNVVPADAPSGGTVDPEQIEQAVNGYLEENPPSGMTAEQEQQLNQNTTDVADLKSASFKDEGENSEFSIVSGNIISVSTGVQLNSSSLRRTDYIEIPKWARGICVTSSKNYSAHSSGGLCFYDVEKTFISGISFANKNVVEAEIPEGTVYVVVALQDDETTLKFNYFNNTSDLTKTIEYIYKSVDQAVEDVGSVKNPTTNFMREDVDFPRKSLWNNTGVSVGQTLPQVFNPGTNQADQYFSHREQIFKGNSISFIGCNQPANTAINKGMVITDNNYVVTKIISYTDLRYGEYTFEEDGYCYLSFGVTNDSLPLFKIIKPIDFAAMKEFVDNLEKNMPGLIREQLSVQPISLITQEYLLDAVSSVICIGDSVTEGVTTGASSIRRDLSYPARLSKMTGWTIENAGAAGLTTLQWWQNKFSSYTYSDYQTAIIELGYNGGLTDTINSDTAGDNYEQYADTNTGSYCKIIEGMKAQNSKIFIVLIISPGFSANVANVVMKIAEKYSLSYIDLRDVSYVNLQDDKYHGKLSNDNMDYTHMNAVGYLAKAEFIRTKLIKIFEDNISTINSLALQE